jgi:hypothetical protein
MSTRWYVTNSCSRPNCLSAPTMLCLAALWMLTTGTGCGGDSAQGERLGDPIPERIARGALQIGLEIVAEGLTAPNGGTVAPGWDNLLLVADQDGAVWAIDLQTGQKSVFLDIRKRLVQLNRDYDERGLLGLAFQPKFQENGHRLLGPSRQPREWAEGAPAAA